MKKVTAGRDMLGDFAPKFAAFNMAKEIYEDER